MAIKSDIFGCVELSDNDAARFKPNAQAKASYTRGCTLISQVQGLHSDTIRDGLLAHPRV